VKAASPTASDVPHWPKITAILNADGSGRLTVNGVVQDLAPGDLDAARGHVLERVIATADSVGRAVRLHSTDPDGQWELAVHPDGHVDELAAHPVEDTAPAATGTRRRERARTGSQPVDRAAAAITGPAPAEPRAARRADPDAMPHRAPAARAPLSRAQRKWAGDPPARRRVGHRAARIAVVLSLLGVLIAATAFVVTSGPDTVVGGSDSAPPRAISQSHENVVADAIADAQRRGTERRAAAAAADRRTARRALQRRVSARQARERRAARRALQRRVGARQARERRAARRAAPPRPSTPTRTRATPPPPPAAVTPPPPPPPARPRPCGEFDLC